MDAISINVRDRRFCRGRTPSRWWNGGDPVATAWFNALSGTFPRGEAFFIEAVKAHREGAPPELAEAIRAFVVQEVNHTREHVAFNRMARDAGYDMDRVDRHVEALLAMTRGRPVILDLAATMALEHYTAMMAHEFLANPRHVARAELEAARLWQWHAIEEIEHKGVAYDTWLHATRNWTRWKRWKVKALLMMIVTGRFLTYRIHDTLDLLAQDGIHGPRAWFRLASYLLVKPGILRRIFPEWVRYFLPGFHPWNRDDLALIAAAERSLESG